MYDWKSEQNTDDLALIPAAQHLRWIGDARFGLLDQTGVPIDETTLDRTQWRAVYFENILRSELNIELRAKDGNQSVLDLHGRPIYVAPPRIFWLDALFSRNFGSN